jgi:hypothetical protein
MEMLKLYREDSANTRASSMANWRSNCTTSGGAIDLFNDYQRSTATEGQTFLQLEYDDDSPLFWYVGVSSGITFKAPRPALAVKNITGQP